jgi:hypothetical protein
MPQGLILPQVDPTTIALPSSGSVGATNTVAIQVTIGHGSGSSTNHTCEISAAIDNANASGVTLS